MKRLLSVLGVIALLGTLFVLAGPSASADPVLPIKVNVENKSSTTTMTVTAQCLDTSIAPVTLLPTKDQTLQLPGECTNWTVMAVDAAGASAIGGYWGTFPDIPDTEVIETGDKNPLEDPGNVLSGVGSQPRTGWWINFDTDGCAEPGAIDIYKIGLGLNAFAPDTFNFTIAADEGSPAECGGPWSASTETMTQVKVEVPDSVLVGNAVKDCSYVITEAENPPWELKFAKGDGDLFAGKGEGAKVASSNGSCLILGSADLPEELGLPEFTLPHCGWAVFGNELVVPLLVTKTFVGRPYYTTVERADFHLFTPGLCTDIPIDPFGNLLGSIGFFRTINASQDPQLVMAVPNTVVAAPWGTCTYRVQENNAPEGCTALSPTGSNADGPYWEQAWAPGVTELAFHIVNDCSEPEPTPTPSVAPTTAPKKPGAKKPSGGGSAAPKFTG